ncbi:major capsid protein [Aquabacterium sp. A08]|nr:major capsid protein [Aquabacterium sp. A08]NIC43563.1 hypothetical protein [Aquabacterium sp. A08]
MDVAAVVSEIQGALTPVGAIGVAILGLAVGIKLIGWIKSALSK